MPLFGRGVVNIIPEPAETSLMAGEFIFSDQTRLIAKGAEALQNIEFLNAFVQKRFGFMLKSGSGRNCITIAMDAQSENEAYKLTVAEKGITIIGGAAGLFYGVQTLQQLLEGADSLCAIPCLNINDRPRFGYRGFMLDVGRYFYPVEYLKRYFDLMAHYKFNVFHWHLTEDCGWRIEIKKHPELTRKAAWRSSTQITYEGGSDHIPHGGYYTQAQARELIAYAAARHITIIPEIEMPGHTLAALAVHPELSCTGGPFAVPTLWEKGRWELEDDIFCAGNDGTFAFLQDVLGEIIDLFPSKYIHIGGDEAPKKQWKQCPKCQTRIKSEGLKDEDELQSYFVKRIERYINSRGRQVIGWDEILQGGLAPNAAVMSWRGEEGGMEASRLGHQAVMAPHQYMYLDYYSARDRSIEPVALGGFLPMEMVYGYEPYGKLSPEQQKNIMGVQTCIWMEFVHSEAHLDYMTFPRAMAVAEVAWSPAARKDYASFLRRVHRELATLDRIGVLFRIPEPEGWDSVRVENGEAHIALTPPVEGAQVLFTVDGRDPSAYGAEYRHPVRVAVPADSLSMKCVVVLPSGRASAVYTMKQK
jgi:hexosaminidase